MVTSLLEIQKQVVIDAIRNVQPPETWRCVVTDQSSHRILMNVMDEHDILNERATGLEKIEDKRSPQPLECIYILTPEEHIVGCLISDYARPKPRYTCAHLLWTYELPDSLRQKIINSPARGFIQSERVLSLDFFPRESHLFTFREPTSFYSLFHPECSNFVRQHIKGLAQKIVCVCVTLGEYPTIRYYRSPNMHLARVLSEQLAKTVQDQLDEYAQNHADFPPQSNLPRGVLFVVDRSLDLFAPVLHEFTYQAMAHDLLPIKDGEKVTYKVEIATADNEMEEKEMELGDHDQVWVSNRHKHMKDTIEKLMADFQKFLGDNKNFVDSSSSTSLYAIRDMMATLPQYQGQKDMYSLHLTMAQECMAYFEKKRLPEVALLEQSLSTGFDETGRTPRNAAEALVRLLDDPALNRDDRVRLIMLYMLYKDGLLEGDMQKLILHSKLHRRDENPLRSLALLGARVTKPLKERAPSRSTTKSSTSLSRKPSVVEEDEGSDFSRYVTALKTMLEDHVRGTLDPELFPYTKPELVPVGPGGQGEVSQPSSLRSAKPTWARSRISVIEPRQRVIVFMAGGASYSESRACYEVSKTSVRDIFLGSSHMLTPSDWLTQLQNLQQPRMELDMPQDRPKKEIPRYLLEPDPVPKPPPQLKPVPAPPPVQKKPSPQPPTKEMGGLKVHQKPQRPYYEEEKKKKKKFGVF